MCDERTERKNHELNDSAEAAEPDDRRPLWHPRAYGLWLEDDAPELRHASIMGAAQACALPLDTPVSQLPNSAPALKGFIANLQFKLTLLEGVIAATRTNGDPEGTNPFDLND